MKVRGLELPNTLQTVLLNGVWTSRGKDFSGIWHDDYHIALFKKLFPRVEGYPWPSYHLSVFKNRCFALKFLFLM
jgi:hypothetical protein